MADSLQEPLRLGFVEALCLRILDRGGSEVESFSFEFPSFSSDAVLGGEGAAGPHQANSSADGGPWGLDAETLRSTQDFLTRLEVVDCWMDPPAAQAVSFCVCVHGPSELSNYADESQGASVGRGGLQDKARRFLSRWHPLPESDADCCGTDTENRASAVSAVAAGVVEKGRNALRCVFIWCMQPLRSVRCAERDCWRVHSRA